MPITAPAPEPEPRPKIDTEAIASNCYATTARATAEHIAYIFDVAQERGRPFSESHATAIIEAALLAAKHLHAEFEKHVIRALEVQAAVDDELRRRREAGGDA